MQFPVPQFTDVEDKIIGPLTLKQFGIVFVAGIIIFTAYSVSKNTLVAVFFFMLFGLPALALAFGKLNGRPMYNSIPLFIKFAMSPKVLIFHKEASIVGTQARFKNVEIKIAEKKEVEVTDPKAKAREIKALLEKQAREEKELLKKIQ